MGAAGEKCHRCLERQMICLHFYRLSAKASALAIPLASFWAEGPPPVVGTTTLDSATMLAVSGRETIPETEYPPMVDTSLIDAMLDLPPTERLRQNDRMLRTIEELRRGIRENRPHDADR